MGVSASLKNVAHFKKATVIKSDAQSAIAAKAAPGFNSLPISISGSRLNVDSSDCSTDSDFEFVYNLKSQSFKSDCCTKNKTLRPDNFDILLCIGKGTFGKVYKVRSKKDNQIYAMKVIKKEKILQSNCIIELLKEEKNILESISHPFIVKLKYAFQSKHKLHLVMEYLSGGELYYLLHNFHRLDVERVRFYAAQIFSAMSYLHSLNIIYRDLKSENLVLDKTGNIILTDFGLALRTNCKGVLSGTPEYLAPEVVARDKPFYSFASDWWSFGVLIYEMLVGGPPFYSDDYQEMYCRIQNNKVQYPSDLPDDAKDLLEGLFRKDPKERYDEEHIRNHRFFRTIDWELLIQKKITPPYVPSSNDFKNFDPEFTKSRPADSIVDTPRSENKEALDPFIDYIYNGDYVKISHSASSYFLDDYVKIDATIGRKSSERGRICRNVTKGSSENYLLSFKGQ